MNQITIASRLPACVCLCIRFDLLPHYGNRFTISERPAKICMGIRYGHHLSDEALASAIFFSLAFADLMTCTRMKRFVELQTKNESRPMVNVSSISLCTHFPFSVDSLTMESEVFFMQMQIVISSHLIKSVLFSFAFDPLPEKKKTSSSVDGYHQFDGRVVKEEKLFPLILWSWSSWSSYFVHIRGGCIRSTYLQINEKREKCD